MRRSVHDEAAKNDAEAPRNDGIDDGSGNQKLDIR